VDISLKKLYEERPNVQAVHIGPNESIMVSTGTPKHLTGIERSISLNM
jgi:cysteine synthase